uniref:Splicing factor YJU2 n=1 Tax=Panagrolaimus davidi TaxID=227884 RepID=A0A914R2G6_9BILA
MTGTERKVFQKYYPPEYDPSKLPKAKGGRNRQFVQRVMAPYNMQCNTCHEYIYKGKKFNMRRETAEGENYLGLRLFRFYFRCPNCLAEISFKTDLENCDYQQEHGATRLFDAFKHYQEQSKKEEAEEEAEKADAMKMLEKRTQMSKKEMQAMGELEEIQELNRRNEGIDARDFVLDDKQKALLIAEKHRIEAEQDEEIIRNMFYKPRADGHIIRRIEDDEDELSQEGSLGILGKRKLNEKKMVETVLSGAGPSSSKPQSDLKTKLKGLVVVKKAKINAETDQPSSSSSGSLPGHSKPPDKCLPSSSKVIANTTTVAGPTPAKKGLLLLGSYNSDSD